MFTKIWDDEFFVNLTPQQKLLFIYLITNPLIGLTGIYELSDRRIRFDTGLTQEEIEQAKQLFEGAGKIAFKDGWVYAVKSQSMNGYRGEKLNPALQKEMSLIRVDLLNHFKNLDFVANDDRVSIVYQQNPIHLKTINNKSETINHKEENIVKEEIAKEVVFKILEEKGLRHPLVEKNGAN